MKNVYLNILKNNKYEVNSDFSESIQLLDLFSLFQ